MQKLLRTIVLGATLVAGGMVAMPVQAQFSSDFGEGEFYDGPFRLCLGMNSLIRRAITRQGYTNVYLNIEHDQRIEARATQGKWVYLLEVNACSGRVLDRKRLRPA
jgi:hypothetical protein